MPALVSLVFKALCMLVVCGIVAVVRHKHQDVKALYSNVEKWMMGSVVAALIIITVVYS